MGTCTQPAVDESEGTMMIERTLPAGLDTPRAVRGLIERLRDSLGRIAYQHARLLASEAAANAVVHGAQGADIRFVAELENDRLRVEICNQSGMQRPHIADREPGEGGLGLQILDGLANSWGTEHNDHTLVWFELHPVSE